MYLVKDCDNIVFYSALSSELLYKEIGAENILLSDVEKEIINLCMDAFLKGNQDYVMLSSSYPSDWNFEEEQETLPIYKLVEYYKNELKFEDVRNVTILLPKNRKAAWIQHSDVNS